MLGKLDVTRSSRDLSVHARRVNGALVILNVSTDNTLASTDSHIIRTKTINHLKRFFPIATKEGSVLSYLNYRITQSSAHVTLDQSDHMSKITTKHFSKAPYTKTDIPFRNDREVENDIANSQLCDSTALSSLMYMHGDYSSNYGAMKHVTIISRFDASYSMED